MIIDCHYHLETRIVPLEELIQNMDNCGIDRTVLMAPMVEPFPEPAPFLVGLLQFFLTQRAFRRIGKALVANFTSDGDVRILGRAYRIEKEMNNEIVFETVRKYPDRFFGWVFVNPLSTKDPVKELEKYSGEPGFAGVKAHPFWHHYEPVKLLPVAEQAPVTPCGL